MSTIHTFDTPENTASTIKVISDAGCTVSDVHDVCAGDDVPPWAHLMRGKMLVIHVPRDQYTYCITSVVRVCQLIPDRIVGVIYNGYAPCITSAVNVCQVIPSCYVVCVTFNRNVDFHDDVVAMTHITMLAVAATDDEKEAIRLAKKGNKVFLKWTADDPRTMTLRTRGARCRAVMYDNRIPLHIGDLVKHVRSSDLYEIVEEQWCGDAIELDARYVFLCKKRWSCNSPIRTDRNVKLATHNVEAIDPIALASSAASLYSEVERSMST